MAAELIIIGNIHTPPSEQVVVTGTERIHTQHGFRDVTFYHVIDITGLGTKAKRNDIVEIKADILPDPKRNGRVKLQAKNLTIISEANTQESWIAPFGMIMVTIEGKLACDPKRQKFSDGQTLVNLAMHVQPGQGLLEIAVYGLSTTTIAELRKTDRLRLMGRLISQKRPDSQGEMKLYTKVELPRLQIIDSKTQNHA